MKFPLLRMKMKLIIMAATCATLLVSSAGGNESVAPTISPSPKSQGVNNTYLSSAGIVLATNKPSAPPSRIPTSAPSKSNSSAKGSQSKSKKTSSSSKSQKNGKSKSSKSSSAAAPASSAVQGQDKWGNGVMLTQKNVTMMATASNSAGIAKFSMLTILAAIATTVTIAQLF
jgi:hypothetical protein